MSLVTGDEISVAFGKKIILEDASFAVQPGERVGLIGPNGSGKSTLLRLLAGERESDAGDIAFARGVRAGYLPQDILELPQGTLVDSVRAAVGTRDALATRLAAAEEELAAAEDDETRLEIAGRLADLHASLDDFEARYGRHVAEAILFGLGFSKADLARDVAHFSGGWKMRAALAGLLLSQPDLLLLDEPTNHLDVPSLQWFAQFLKRARGAVLLVSHDRDFLNEQIGRVLSFEPEGLRSYPGDYDQYKRQRAEEELNLELRAARQAAERAQIQSFVDRFRYKATKAKQAQSRIKKLEKMEVIQTRDQRATVSFRFPEVARSGGEVVRVENVHKAFGDKVVYRGLTATVSRGDRVAIIGVNGAGKSTLLKIIAGELAPEAGQVTLGANVKCAYYAQHHTDTLQPERTILDETWDLVPSMGQAQVRSVLGSFLFEGDEVDKKIGVLSGGERARVALARLLLVPSNLMLMDEPTNHLDLDSAEKLVEALKGYGGTLVFVSHNRSFVNQLATKVWDVQAGGVGINEWSGNLNDYLWHLERIGQPMGGVASSAPVAAGGMAAPARVENDRERRQREAREREARNTVLRPIQAEIAGLETRIAALEIEQKSIEPQLEEPGFYEDFARAQPLLDRYRAAKEELESLYAAWEAAQAKLEAAQA
jgi:ATP-binding cassette subfamily F protein 3